MDLNPERSRRGALQLSALCACIWILGRNRNCITGHSQRRVPDVRDQCDDRCLLPAALPGLHCFADGRSIITGLADVDRRELLPASPTSLATMARF